MSEGDLELALAAIAGSPDADFAGPKPEGLIALAERALGLTFPPTYRMFLSRLGCGGIPGYEFYGLIDDNFEHSSVPNAIWLTLDERRSADLPLSFILVSHTGYTGYYAIDVSQITPTGDSPVVEWQLCDPPDMRRPIAEDFGAFLWECVRSTARKN